MKEECFFFKKTGLSTDYPSDMPYNFLKFLNDISNCKLLVSIGKKI